MTRHEFLIQVRDALGSTPELERDLKRHAPAKSKKPFVVSAFAALLALILTTTLATDTEARRRVRVVETDRQCIADDRYLCGSGTSVFGTPYPVFEPLMPRMPRKAKQSQRAKPSVKVAAKPVPTGTIAAYQEKIYREAKGVSLRGVVKRLANKAREISAKCGSTVTSAVRRGAMVCGGYGCSTSNHALGKAVDMQGNYRCMYALLRKWPGGVSTDPARVKHVHISYNPGGKEWGARFAHNGYSTRRTRIARYRG